MTYKMASKQLILTYAVLVCLNFLAVYMPCVSQEVQEKRKSKEYILNLDLPAEDRWKHVAVDYKQYLPELNKALRKLIPVKVLPLVEKIAAAYDQFLPAPFADEMKGIAKAVNVNEGDIVIGNLVYDLTVYCTSIVAQDANGLIWHARNLDYDMKDALSNITATVHFQKQNKTIYSAVTYVGYVGILTGQKPNAFTVSLDERRTKDGHWWENALIALLDRKASLVSFSIRETMDQATNFKGAVQSLASETTISPCYYILGGVNPGEGAVITKERFGARDIWYLNPEKNRWYLVETNYDHWKPTPKTDPRREVAIKAMNATGQDHIGKATLFKVMSTPPVLNKRTTYTSIMSAAQPKIFQMWIR